MVKAGVPFPFIYNSAFGTTGLFVRAVVKDITDLLSPSVVATIDMTDLGDGQYAGQYTGDDEKNYAVSMKVYTDGTYSTLDTNQSTDTYFVQSASLSSGGGSGSGSEGSTVAVSTNDETIAENENDESFSETDPFDGSAANNDGSAIAFNEGKESTGENENSESFSETESNEENI